MATSDPQAWHRLFGLSWTDFFRGTPVVVELEKDLSLKQQLLDVVLIRKEAVVLPRRLPDGFEDLGAHNLVSFKSYQEALDGWALNELVGHYVNYRKQVSPSMRQLLPESHFRLFAVCVRFPENLAGSVPLVPLRAGVYQARHFSGEVRVVVVNQLELAEHNAMLHLFSARQELVRYRQEHYQPHSPETSTFLHKLLSRYEQEGIAMPDGLKLLEEMHREAVEEILRETPPEKLLAHVPPEKILEHVPIEKRLEGLSAEKRLEGLSADELIRSIPPETLKEIIRRMKVNGSSPKPE